MSKKRLNAREAKLYKDPIVSRLDIVNFLNMKGACSFSKLCNRFNIKNKKKQLALEKRLSAMQRDLQVFVDKKSKYNLVKQTMVMQGAVIKFKDGIALVLLDNGEHAVIAKRHSIELMLDDRVVVIVSNKILIGHKKAYLADILTRAWQEVIGFYCSYEDGEYVRLARPLVPSGKIKILASSVSGLLPNDSVVAKIVEYPEYGSLAKCKIESKFVPKNNLDLDVEIALQAYNIPYVWPEAVVAEIKKIPNVVLEQDLKHRSDLRHLPFVTIDGKSAKDFDDAIFVDALPAGGWVLWVAIADVGYYVKQNSAIDLEARERGNSVYFPSQVIPMLPFELSDNLCSLQPKVDRLAVVISIEIGSNGKVLGRDIQRSVIRSHARLTYEYVESVRFGGEVALASIQDSLCAAFELDKVLSKLKFDRGAVDFFFTEASVVYNSHNEVEDIVASKRLSSHGLIENFMLCANNQIAAMLTDGKVPAIFRVHAEPAQDKLESLQQLLATLGVKFRLSAGRVNKSLQEMLSQAKLIDGFEQIQLMVLKSMTQANYQAKDLGHFGLAYRNYTHFTSPIRRYADLVVHRAIIEELLNISKQDLEQVAAQCSITERRADRASRDVMDKLKCRFMESKIGEGFVGVVVSVTNFGLFIRLQRHVVEGLLHINELPRDSYSFDAERFVLEGRQTKSMYKIGQVVDVVVDKVDVVLGRVDFKLKYS